MRYPVEQFTAEERALLAPHFTNLDRPVFALVNLPETVKGALFARYSRYSGTVRRLYLEEFAADAPARRAALRRRRGRARRGALRTRLPRLRRRLDRPGRRRPRRLRVGLQHPHQGPAARPPRRLPGAVDPLHPLRQAAARGAAATATTATTSSAPSSARRWTRSSRSTRARCSRSSSGRRSAGRAATDEPEGPWQRSIRAKALDLLRGLLPAATLSHVGIYASGQAYEQLLLRLMASPLPEAREYGGMILSELKQVMPSFVSRVERPDRGGEWIAYLRAAPRADRAVGLAARPRPARRRRGEPLGRAGPRRRQRREPARLLPVRVGLASRRPRSSPASTCSTATSAPSCSPRWSASEPTAATAPAAASRRCATASRSSPTTAPSATCSATAC